MRCDRCKAIVSDHDSHICQNINEAISNPREMCDHANMVIDRAISQGLITFMTPTARGSLHALMQIALEHEVEAGGPFVKQKRNAGGPSLTTCEHCGRHIPCE